MGITALITTLAVSAAASVGEGIYAAVSQPSAPKAPTTTDTAQQQAQASQAAALAQANALTKRRGMASTVLTGPMGATTAPTTQKATLGA
jgi:hypothetical protein